MLARVEEMKGHSVVFPAPRGGCHMLYAVTPRHPWTFAVLLLIVGTLASLPAHRAATTDPLAVLRSE